jgi:hypothetical protein
VANKEQSGAAVEDHPDKEQIGIPDQDPVLVTQDDRNCVENSDKIGKDHVANDEDNGDASVSRLRSGKAPSTPCKQQPKLTGHEFYRRRAEAAEAERRKNTTKGGKSSAALACRGKRAASKTLSSGSSRSSSGSSSVSNSLIVKSIFWFAVYYLDLLQF